MVRIQSNFTFRNNLFLTILFSFLIQANLNAQRGLHYTPEEIQVWRQRAGLTPGNTMYKSFGDVSANSPGDWDRILADALTAVDNPSNDRFTNYDVTQGLDRPITELTDPWVTNRTTQVDDKEPRPGINRRDYGAISIMNAGFVHLMIGGDDGSISGRKGIDFANAVRGELLWYAQNKWLDFSNRNRWSTSKPFYDRNPGFFIACWLNSMLNAYDYTKGSSVYSASDRAIIDKWMVGASSFFHDIMILMVKMRFKDYDNGTYADVPRNFQDKDLGPVWDGSTYRTYGLNEGYANRASVIWRFIMRAGLFYKDHPVYGATAREHVKSSHRWFKEWVAFGTFSDGTYSDFHRGDRSRPQTGLFYSSIGIGAMVEVADAYERNFKDEPGFESLYSWELRPGTPDYALLYPSATEGRPWRRLYEPKEPKGLRKILVTYLKHFDGSYGDSRKWGVNKIDGHSSQNVSRVIVDSDRWFCQANVFYQDDYIRSVYTRQRAGIRQYDKNPTKAGSYDINIGVWGSAPGILFMYGQMENLVWPYDGRLARKETKVINLLEEVNFGQVKINSTKNKFITISNSGNSVLNIESIISDNPLFSVKYSGEIMPYSSVDVSVGFSPIIEGYQSTTLTVNSDKTDGNNKINITGLGVFEITQPEIFKIEAEVEEFEVLVDMGSKSQVQNTTSTSSYLSNNKAVKLYDVGDKVRYTFEISENAEYQIGVRLRSGNTASPTAYWPNGYNFYLNNSALSMQGDMETLSIRDASFGTSYWGTMYTEVLPLEAGLYTLDIEANISWAIVDYIEIIKKSSQVVQTRVLDIQDSVVFDGVQVGQVVEQEISLANNGNAPLTITSSKTSSTSFRCDFAGTIEPGKTASALVVYSPVEIGDQTAQIEFISDKTEGESILLVVGKCRYKPKFHTSLIEAEKAFEVASEIGNKGFVEVGADKSEFLSGGSAVQLFDIGDVMRIPFRAPYDGKFTIKVRLRVGDRSSSTAYLPDGYSLNVNNIGTSFTLENGSVSQQDDSYGIAYWGTLQAISLDLKKGENFLNIIAKRNWAAVDYVELIGEEELKPAIQVTSNLDFGDIDSGSKSEKNLTIKNIGNDTLVINNIETNGAFTTGWTGNVLPGGQQVVTVTFSPNAETSYTAELTIFAKGVPAKNVSLTGTGIRPAPISFVIEAEDSYQIISDEGVKGKVMATAGESKALSNGKAVQLYDVNDRIRMPFEVPKKSLFLIKVKLRAGNHVNSTAFLPDGYEFFLNNQKQNFSAVEESISTLVADFGRSTWGIMSSIPLSLEEGKHVLEIEAKLPWALVDYIEIIEVGTTSSRLLDHGKKLFMGESSQSLSVHAYPNPVTDYLKLSIESPIHQEGQVTILDTFGKVVYRGQVDNYNNESNIDATSFARGFYLVRIELNGEMTTKRILVE